MKASLIFSYWLAKHAMEGAILSKHNHSTIPQDDCVFIPIFFLTKICLIFLSYPYLKKENYAEQRHKNVETRFVQGTGAGELACRAESTCS